MLISKSVRTARKGGLHPMHVDLRSLASDVPDVKEGIAMVSQDIGLGKQGESNSNQDTAAELQHAWWHFLPPCGG